MPRKTTDTKRVSKRDAARNDLPEGELKKSDGTRLRILNAAAFILSQQGYSGTKLADIAKKADLRISTLYYYFESREDLVLDVLLTGSSQVRKHTELALSDLPAEMSPVDRVCAAVEAHLRYILEISHYTEAAVRNTGQLPAHMRSEVAKEQDKYGRLWQSLIDDATNNSSSYSSASERRSLRLLLIGAVNWTVEWWTPARASIDDVVRTALTMTRKALEAP